MKRILVSFGAVMLIGAAAAAQPTKSAVTAEKIRRLDQEAVAVLKATRVPVEASVIQGAPYSAEVVTESVQVLGDGNRIVRKTTGRVYRDGQGRTRREQDIEPGRVGTVSINDPVGRVSYSLDVDQKIGWKSDATIAGYFAFAKVMPPPPPPADPAALERRKQVEAEITKQVAEVAGARGGGRGGRVRVSPVDAPPPPPPPPEPRRGRATTAPPGWDEKTEKLPARNIEGVMAEVVRTTRTIPAGAIGNEQAIVTVTEEWRSPELKVLVLTRTSDPRTGESTYRLLNIARAEPAPSWFEVPGDYTIRGGAIKKLAPVMK